jgi:hypothetical protein
MSAAVRVDSIGRAYRSDCEVGPKKRPAIDRFMEKVIVVDSGCWIWVGTRNARGYGMFRDEFGRMPAAHTFSYRYHVGKLPPGTEPDHLCREHSCVNWRHLEAVTHRENVLRGASFAAVNARRAACDKCGGELSVSRHGRRCVPCRRAYHREYMKRCRK